VERPPQSDSSLVLIFGRRGVGKTYLAAKLAGAWPLSHVFAFNPANDEKLRVFQSCDVDRPPGLKDCLLVLDELDLLVRPNMYHAPWLQSAVRRGRHTYTSIIGCALRPQLLHRDFATLATRIYIGTMTGDRDLEYCVRNWGEQCLRARGLPARKFLDIIP
jgi:hypothetical protein